MSNTNFGVFLKPGVRKIRGSFNENHEPSHLKKMIRVYLHWPNSRQASARVCYSKYTPNRIQCKYMPTEGYNNIEA